MSTSRHTAMSRSVRLQNGTGADGDDDDDARDSDTEEDVYLRDRRRAKSLPAYPEQANFLERLSRSSRKQVKFADALGLSLFSVKHFSSSEDPEIPSKVFSDLCSGFRAPAAVAEPEERLGPAFEISLSPEERNARLTQGRIALEKVSVTRWDIHGFICALPVYNGHREEVGVRYTFNDWASFADAPAVPAHGQNMYAFTVHAPLVPGPNPRVHFAVYMRCERQEFWDNNDGQNYTVPCGHSPL